MSKQFSGTGVAIVTPFNPDKTIDYPSLENLLTHLIAGEVDYIVALGTTGEAPAINTTERRAILSFIVKIVNGRLPIIAGFANNHTTTLTDQVKQFDFEGIDAILCSSPNYNKPTQEGIYQHYKTLANIAPVPIMLYNVPGRTASNMTASTTLRLANDFPNIIGVKEASGNLAQCMEIINANPREDFVVVSGDDIITLPLMALGADGVVSVIANAMPKEWATMVRQAQQNNYTLARQIHYQLMPLVDLLFEENNPAGVKATLEIMKLIQSDALRLPIITASSQLKEKIRQVIL